MSQTQYWRAKEVPRSSTLQENRCSTNCDVARRSPTDSGVLLGGNWRVSLATRQEPTGRNWSID